MKVRSFIAGFVVAALACGAALAGLNEIAADMNAPKGKAGCEITRADDNSTQYARLPSIVARGGTEVLLLGTSRTKFGFKPEVRHVLGTTTNAALMSASYETMRVLLSHWPAPAGARVIVEAPFGMERRNGLEHWVDPPSPQSRAVALLDVRPVLTQFLSLEGRERMRSDCRGFPMQVLTPANADKFDREGRFWHARMHSKEIPDLAESLLGLRLLIQDALDRGYRVDVWIPPVHACSMEAGWRAGYRPKAMEWIRLVAGLTGMTGQNGRPDHVRAWDFSGYNAVTTEPLPVVGSAWQSRYFSDPGHIMGPVGEGIARQLTGQPVPEDIAGQPLDPSTVDAYLRKQEELRRAYLVREPGVSSGCAVGRTAASF
ncbi:MAG: hypothetical protein AB7O49_10520 [Sphingomonadales bacterium]